MVEDISCGKHLPGAGERANSWKAHPPSHAPTQSLTTHHAHYLHYHEYPHAPTRTSRHRCLRLFGIHIHVRVHMQARMRMHIHRRADKHIYIEMERRRRGREGGRVSWAHLNPCKSHGMKIHKCQAKVDGTPTPLQRHVVLLV